jgi:hypothetical protein
MRARAGVQEKLQEQLESGFACNKSVKHSG